MPAEAAGDLVALVVDGASVAGRGGWVVGAGRGRCEVWDVLGDGVAGANVGYADV